MTSFEMIYFDVPGRAEACRICLFIANKDFKDTRFGFKDWPSIKPTTPLGSVPVLKIDGVAHTQSIAMARYAGKLAGWYPEDPLEALVCDEILDTLNELTSKAPRSKDPAEMKKLREEFQAGTMTQFSDFVEAAIQRNGGVGVAKSPSIADIVVKGQVDSIKSGMWDHIDPNFYEKYPGIMATYKMIAENEQIKAYYASRK